MSFEKDNDFKGLGFEPNQKELDMFNKEKMDMYKGTFFVCLMYGLTAFALLIVIFFTEWGREFVYKKMLPAAVTFIFGAVFIILYLVISIYDLKPRKVRNRMEKDNDIVCPDYWKLKLIPAAEKNDIVTNNNVNNTKLYHDIRNDKDETLKYKCVLDETVFADLKSINDTKKTLFDTKTEYYQKAKKYENRNDANKVDYLYVVKKDTAGSTTAGSTTDAYGTYTDDKLSNYAQFSGMYRSGIGATVDSITSIGTSGAMKNIQPNSLLHETQAQATANFYHSKKPLICNVVYPQVLAKLDKETPEQNKYRCAYAKACDIPWTGIGCEPTKGT
jgi:hypothetical protein